MPVGSRWFGEGGTCYRCVWRHFPAGISRSTSVRRSPCCEPAVRHPRDLTGAWIAAPRLFLGSCAATPPPAMAGWVPGVGGTVALRTAGRRPKVAKPAARSLRFLRRRHSGDRGLDLNVLTAVTESIHSALSLSRRSVPTASPTSRYAPSGEIQGNPAEPLGEDHQRRCTRRQRGEQGGKATDPLPPAGCIAELSSLLNMSDSLLTEPLLIEQGQFTVLHAPGLGI